MKIIDHFHCIFHCLKQWITNFKSLTLPYKPSGMHGKKSHIQLCCESTIKCIAHIIKNNKYTAMVFYRIKTQCAAYFLNGNIQNIKTSFNSGNLATEKKNNGRNKLYDFKTFARFKRCVEIVFNGHHYDKDTTLSWSYNNAVLIATIHGRFMIIDKNSCGF